MDKLVQAVPMLASVLALGFAACLPLYNWNIRKFTVSPLGVKVLMWVPLYVFFAVVAEGNFMVIWFVIALIALLASAEFFLQQHHARSWWYFVYFMITLAGWVGSIVVVHRAELWMALCLSSVFSDVTAFFMGNYAGAHHLPAFINSRKSYEGAAGQVIGGMLGVVLFGGIFGVAIPLWLGALIGVASLAGDLLNSVAKRLLGIKDWGNTIPGHGGVMDRFSSLNCALCLVCLAYLLFP